VPTIRRSDFVIKLMSVVLLVAIAVYIGLYIYNTAENPLKTTVAVRYTAEESGSADGYIVRTETVLTGGGSAITLMASEGERVAKGQALAVSYEGESALRRASEIRALQIEISAAEEEADAGDKVKTMSADGSVLALSSAVQRGNLENLPKLTYYIKNLIFKTERAHSETDLNTLKDKLSGLMAQNTDTETISSPMSGVFSAVVDGYEATGPEALQDLTPTALQAFFSPTPKPGGDILGKLITDITWYYAAVMDAADARRLQENLEKGTPADIQFTKLYNAKLMMSVESIGAEENGKCVVVFSSKTNMSDITALRKLTAQVLFDTHGGLLVPKEAVYHEEGDGGNQTYIYLLTGLQAEKVPVTVLCENGDSFVVQDGAENGTVLRVGSEIIVKARDLYDGKVVAR
jgi:hypothetical protein